MTRYTRASAVPSSDAEPKDLRGQRSVVLALLATVVLLDQATKWWGWRHMSGALVNSGGAPLTGPVVGGWYAGGGTGRLLDIIGVGFLSIAIVLLLVHRRRCLAVLAPAALTVGGWSSNLLDRLGTHSWTAPGSARGAVDFLPFSHYRFNLADVVIVGATAMFVLSVGQLRRTAICRPVVAGNPARPLRRRPQARTPASAGAVGVTYTG